MKSFFTLIITVVALTVNAQAPGNWSEIDTLHEYEHKTLMQYCIYLDSMLVEERQAFGYPVIIEVPRFRIFQNWFKTKLSADSLIFHGIRTSYETDGRVKRQIYHNGELLNTQFFNSDGEETSRSEFQSKGINIGPCGVIHGHYFIYGKAER